MGPGLFLAASLAAAPVRAETAVGLDARGVDPMAAVDNRQGLDVRDGLGRPVSGRRVLDELKRAAVARAAEASYASALPRAKTVASALEYATAGAAWLVRWSLPKGGPCVWVSLPAPCPRVLALFLVAFGVAAASAAVRPRGSQASSGRGRCCPEILRC